MNQLSVTVSCTLLNIDCHSCKKIEAWLKACEIKSIFKKKASPPGQAVRELVDRSPRGLEAAAASGRHPTLRLWIKEAAGLQSLPAIPQGDIFRHRSTPDRRRPAAIQRGLGYPSGRPIFSANLEAVEVKSARPAASRWAGRILWEGNFGLRVEKGHGEAQHD